MRIPARRSWPSRRRPPRPPAGWPSNRLDIAPTAPSSLALSCCWQHGGSGRHRPLLLVSRPGERDQGIAEGQHLVDRHGHPLRVRLVRMRPALEIRLNHIGCLPRGLPGRGFTGRSHGGANLGCRYDRASSCSLLHTEKSPTPKNREPDDGKRASLVLFLPGLRRTGRTPPLRTPSERRSGRWTIPNGHLWGLRRATGLCGASPPIRPFFGGFRGGRGLFRGRGRRNRGRKGRRRLRQRPQAASARNPRVQIEWSCVKNAPSNRTRNR